MSDWPFDGLRPWTYGVIVCDPPWSFTYHSAKGHTKKTAQGQYDCMSYADLIGLPVQMLAADDCLLVMWATAPMLPEAVKLMGHWGFTYKTAGAWAKQTSTGKAWAFGTGYILRSAAEFWLVGARGKPRSASRSVRNLIVAPTRGHSRKPDAMHEILELIAPDARKCELFARQRRPGWDAWGNEVDKFSLEEAV